MAHGGYTVGHRQGQGGDGARRTRTEPLDTAELDGFCHWPFAPAADETCQLAMSKDWPKLAAALSQFLLDSAGYPWTAALTPPPGSPGPQDAGDNPFIPSGYTYLLQFLSHDLVSTETPLWAVDPRIGTTDLRASKLRLATLYGGGPLTCPLHYVAGNTAPFQDRYKLQTGGFSGAAPPVPSFGDIKRFLVDIQPRPDNPAETAAADARNADNVIVAQLTALFSALHNAIAEIIDRTPAAVPTDLPESVKAHRVFDYARTVVLSIYRRIVLGELMDKILHPDICGAYRGGSPTLWNAGGIPLELTHGVLRFGHAMVRDSYRLQAPDIDPKRLSDILASFVFPGPVCQIEAQWAVSWKMFFNLDPAVRPNYSRRIGPAYSHGLVDPDIFEPIAPVADPADRDGLAQHDLHSALLAGLWSVDALIEAIDRLQPSLLPRGWSLREPSSRRGEISAWLTIKNNAAPLLTEDQIAAIARDPPLPLFVLMEAALDPPVAGKHLGVVGSIILADVLTSLAARTPLVATAIIREALPPPDAAAIEAINTMAGCIDYLTRQSPQPARSRTCPQSTQIPSTFGAESSNAGQPASII